MLQDRLTSLRERAAEVPAVAWKAPPSWLPPTLHSLAYRDYLLLLLGQLSNSLAMWMEMVARPVLVIALTGSAVQLGLITMVRGVPFMLLGPFAGLLADRVDRRLLMLIAKVLNFVVSAVFAAVILLGQLQLWHVYAYSIVRSLLMAFDGPARQALLPSLVPTHLLANAVALNMGSMQVMRILSASIAGIFIGLWALALGFEDTDARAFGGVFLAIAIASAVAVVATYLLRVPLAGRVERSRGSWGASLIEGFSYARRTPIILGVLILFAVQSTFGMAYLSIFVPWLAIEVMGLGAGGAGMLIAFSGVGSLAGAIVIATVGHRLHHRGRIVILGLAFYGAFLAALGLTSTLPLVALFGLMLPVVPMAMVVLVGIGQSAVMSIKTTLLFENTPNELRGRVMSLQSLDRGFTTIGSAAGGFSIALIGGPYGLALFGAVCAVGALVVGALNRGLRDQD